VGATVMKNWLPLVFGPALAMESFPAFELAQAGMEFVRESCNPGPPRPVALRASALNHESPGYAVKKSGRRNRAAFSFFSADRVLEFLGAFGEADKVFQTVFGVSFFKQPANDVAHRSFKINCVSVLRVAPCALLFSVYFRMLLLFRKAKQTQRRAKEISERSQYKGEFWSGCKNAKADSPRQ